MTDQSQVPGPIDFLLLEFPDREPTGAAAGALADLLEQGTIALYDIVAIRKTDDGAITAVELAELGIAGFAEFVGARSGLLGDEDIAEAALAVEPGTVAVLLVYENRWAAPFVAAVHGAGGQLIASARIPAQELIDVLDALDAQG